MPGNSLQKSLESILDNYVRIAAAEPWSTNSQAAAYFDDACSAIQDMLSCVNNEHLSVSYSFGKGNWAKVPWIAIFDDRETTSAQQGVYVVLLFRADMSGVYLTFNQGVTEPKNRLGPRDGREWLRNNATQLRRFCQPLVDRGFSLSEDIELRVEHGLGRDYEASTVAHKLYLKGSVPSDEELKGDLIACVQAYKQYIEDHGPLPTNPPTPTMRDVCDAFASALMESNLNFGPNHLSVVRSFIASLATKRFVILSGLCGSGKTQIALRLGDWLGGTDYAALIPVRPDWTGSEALLGYEDALLPAPDGRKAWHVPRPLRFILQAANNPERPYLLILDEMNLAHVERYFADMLSGMESDYPCLPNLKEEADGHWRVPANAEQWIAVPRNLFVVGTVNVDETTYMFSPKVLDRANTIEFRVSTDDLHHEARKPTPCQPAEPILIETFLAVAKDSEWHVHHPAPYLHEFTEYMRTIHKILFAWAMEFGQRIYTEAVRFASIFYACGEEDMFTSLDLQVMQKILPRFHGSRRRLEEPLVALGRFCYDPESFDSNNVNRHSLDPEDLNAQDAKLPASFTKIQRMLRILRANQFVSFAEYL